MQKRKREIEEETQQERKQHGARKRHSERKRHSREAQRCTDTVEGTSQRRREIIVENNMSFLRIRSDWVWDFWKRKCVNLG